MPQVSLPKAAPVIDIVIPWVDGDDPIWRAKYHQLLNRTSTIRQSNDSFLPLRYQNRNELKYSLRSIHQNLNWCRNIFLVTDHQIPDWLKKEQGKIKLVCHEDFIPKEYLPTFQSMAFESFISEIPGLSEIFIYMNDDLFIAKPLKIETFFKNGLLTVFLEKFLFSATGVPTPSELSFFSAWKNLNILLDRHFGVRPPRKITGHTPAVFNKEICREANRIFTKELERTRQSRFRSSECIPTTNGLYPYFSLETDQAEAIELEKTVWDLTDDPCLNHLAFTQINKIDPNFFCIQDQTQEKNSIIDHQFKTFLDFKFSSPAPWEKNPLKTDHIADTNVSSRLI